MLYFALLYSPFMKVGFKCFKATEPLQLYNLSLTTKSMNSWYSFDQPRKDEMLSQAWSNLVVLNPDPLDWECNILTTRPLPHNMP